MYRIPAESKNVSSMNVPEVPNVPDVPFEMSQKYPMSQKSQTSVRVPRPVLAWRFLFPKIWTTKKVLENLGLFVLINA